MANQLLTDQRITFEALDILGNNTCVVPNFYRDLDQEFGKKGAKIGDTIFVRKPQRFIGRDGQAYSPEGLTDTQVPVTINQQSGVDFEFSSAERFLSIDDFKRRTLNPASISLGNKLDLRAALVAMQNTANLVGTPGTAPGASSTDAMLIYRQAGQKIEEMGFPFKETRMAVITPNMATYYFDFVRPWTGSFTPGVTSRYEKPATEMVNALNYDWRVDQNIPTQVIGALGGTPAVNGANQTGTTLAVNGLSDNINGWANVGDNFTIAGVYAVNPQSRQSTGSLQDFVIQSVVNSNGSGQATFTFLPAIVPSGQFQNVTNAPANGSLINIYHTAAAGQSALAGVNSPQGLVWAKQAYAFVSFPGDVADGVDIGMHMAAGRVANDDETGLSLRFIRVYDGYRDQWVSRFDVYYGIAALYMEGGCRVCS